jgi:hypothetical protein
LWGEGLLLCFSVIGAKMEKKKEKKKKQQQQQQKQQTKGKKWGEKIKIGSYSLFRHQGILCPDSSIVPLQDPSNCPLRYP